MKLTFENEEEQLDYELGYLIDHSKDRKFTGYLYQLRGELCCNPEKARDLRKKALSNYDVYVSNMASLGKKVEPYYYGAIYKNMDSPVIKQKSEVEPQPAETSVPEPIAFEPQPAVAPSPVVETQPVLEPEPVVKSEPEFAMKSDFDNMPESVQQPAFEQQPQFVQQPVFNQQPVYTQQPVYNPQPQPAFIPQPQPQPSYFTKPAAPKAEYAVGAIVMSVLGAVFLLTGLVYFAVNFLDTFMQGMLMYLVCFGVLFVSEFVIRKLVEKLSSVFTAIGISGLFLATVVNYRSLENMSLPAAAFVLALCAVMVCLFGYFRKSRLYSAIGFFAAFASSAAIGSESTPAQYLVITLGTLLISCMWMIFPVEKQYKLADTFMIGAEFIYFMFGAGFYIISDNSLTVRICKFVFVLCSWFVMQFIYFGTARRKENEYFPETGIQTANKVIMIAAACVYIFYSTLGVIMADFEPGMYIVAGIVLYLGFVIPSAIFAFRLYKAGNSDWVVYFILLNITGIFGSFAAKSGYVTATVIAVHAIIGRLLSAKDPEDNALKVVDLIVQIFMGFMLVFSYQFFGPSEDETAIEVYFAAAIMIISFAAGLFVSSGYRYFVQIISVFAITIGVITVYLPDALKAACGMGLILMFTCLINSLDKLKPTNDRAYNWFAIVMEILFLHLTAIENNSFVLQDGLIYMIALMLGLCFTILMLNKDYGMPFNGKYIIISAYLTWGFVISPLNKDFLLSIILMAVAVASVVFGFILKEKAIRVYGLVLSIVVCAKIAFIDFVTLDDVKSKTVMYIIVGAFALLIGTIYMVLESRETKAAVKKSE